MNPIYIRSSGPEEHEKALQMFPLPSLITAVERLDPNFVGGYRYEPTMDLTNLQESDFEWVGDSVNGTTDHYTPPSNADVVEMYKVVYQEWKDKEYARHRAIEYPRVEEQMDMMYHDNLNGTTNWKDLVDSIKAAYPKPE